MQNRSAPRYGEDPARKEIQNAMRFIITKVQNKKGFALCEAFFILERAMVRPSFHRVTVAWKGLEGHFTDFSGKTSPNPSCGTRILSLSV
jgi:hypothetical protein